MQQRDIARFERDIGVIGRALHGFANVVFGALEITLTTRERGRQQPGQRIGGDQFERLVKIGACVVRLVERDERARAIEMRFARLRTAERTGAKPSVKIAARLGGFARREHRIARFDPQRRRARVAAAFAFTRGLFERDRGGCPALLRGIGKPKTLTAEQPAARKPPAVGFGNRCVGFGVDQRDTFGKARFVGRGQWRGSGKQQQNHKISNSEAVTRSSRSRSDARDRR